jgi:hypothetical protein
MIDAEESWIQDAIDAAANQMMAQFNLGKVVVYNTIQLYRRDRLSYLTDTLEQAEQSGYIAGLKLVRGAYMEKERARAEEMGYTSPIQPNKESTDKDYDAAVQVCMEKIDLVSRMGANWYSRAKMGLFEVEKPLQTTGIGVDFIPDFIKQSPVLDGNDLGKLGNINSLPTNEEIDIFVKQNFAVKGVLSSDDVQKIHLKAKEYLDNSDTFSAWKLLLAKEI